MKTTLTGKLSTNPFSLDAVVRVTRADGTTEDIATTKGGGSVDFEGVELGAGDRLHLAEHGGKGAMISGKGTLDNTGNTAGAEVYLRDGAQSTLLLRVAADARIPFSFSTSKKGSFIEAVSRAAPGTKPLAAPPAPTAKPVKPNAPAAKKAAAKKSKARA